VLALVDQSVDAFTATM